MIQLLVLLVMAAAAHAHRQHGAVPSTDDPMTTSSSGTFRGSWMTTRKGQRIEGYRGVRYAEPPVGELRFKPPRLITQYKDVVDATQEGPACPQPVENDYPVDEDCLRLNVYTRGHKGKLLPVIVYMHAGGFYSVSGRSDVAGPDYLLDREVVLVAINYRLGSLGFLSTGDEHAPGNNGFKDQVMALRWVQRNIAAFGGDPNLVTITGYSAGSFSVFLHMVSPMSKGLFHRAISMSGSPVSQIVIPEHQRHLAERQARLLGVSADSSKAIVDGLKTKTSKELGDSLLGMFEFSYDPVLIWVPVVEKDFGQERFLTMQPLDVIRQGKMHQVPYIISQTRDEFFWKAFNVIQNETLLKTMNEEWYRIAPISFYLSPNTARHAADRLKEAYLGGKDLVNDAKTADGLGKLYSDAIIGFGVHRLVNLMARYSPKAVFYYEFSYIGEHSHYVDPNTKKPIGAAHHDDLIYLFGVTASFPLIAPSDSEDSKLVDKMTAIWYNFARHGDPNPKGDTPEISALSWPVIKPDSRKYLRIEKEFSLHENLFEDRFKVWEELYPLPK